jgi:hypothetical protein
MTSTPKLKIMSYGLYIGLSLVNFIFKDLGEYILVTKNFDEMNRYAGRLAMIEQ